MKTTLLIMAAGIGSRFGTGIKQLEPVDYAFQDINDIPGTLPEGRTKPWGTGQAVLAAKKVTRPRSSSSMQMITMAKKVSRLFMSIW